MPEELIGKVTHYFGKAGVAGIEITAGELRVGDTIHVVQTVSSKRTTSKPGLGIINYSPKVINQRGEICQEGEWKTMYMMRHAG